MEWLTSVCLILVTCRKFYAGINDCARRFVSVKWWCETAAAWLHMRVTDAPKRNDGTFVEASDVNLSCEGSRRESGSGVPSCCTLLPSYVRVWEERPLVVLTFRGLHSVAAGVLE